MFWMIHITDHGRAVVRHVGLVSSRISLPAATRSEAQ